MPMNPSVFMTDIWPALALTLKLASCTTVVLLLVAIPLAHWLNHSRSRIRPVIELLVSLPIVLPPTVIGFYLLILMSPQHVLGHAWQQLFGTPLPFSFAGLVVGSTLYSLPFAVQPIQTGFRGVDPALIESAAALGTPGWVVLRSVIMRSAWHAVMTGGMLSFAHTVGEFGVVLMLGGNIPGATRVASIALYDQVQQLNYGTANAIALVLLLISFILLALIAVVRGNGHSMQPRLPF
ncbi:MAG: molybdate ABC transporter permease subunit [Burkholderiales bacterium]|nr:molybdate ABC transporter permease subunit [Burkholderiales bacterium]